MERFALSLAFIMRFTATRKWPIVSNHVCVKLNSDFKLVYKTNIDLAAFETRIFVYLY